MSDHVLVIGAGGFIGRHLVQALAARGNKVIAVSRQSIPFQSDNIESIACATKEAENYATWIARTSGAGVRLNELFPQLKNITGIQLLRTYEAMRVVDTPRVVIDSTLAESLCRWMPTTPLDQGLKNTWHWFNTTRH